MSASGGHSCAVWHLLARIHGDEAASAVFALLDNMAAAVSAFETAPEEWRVEAYPRSPVLTPDLRARIALTAAAEGGSLVNIREERLPARDWLAENQAAFPPLRIGRFFVFGSHYRGVVPPGAIPIVVDAATAFGSGEHPSTRACLTALEQLSRRRRYRRPLDVGTGTGILSIAAAKLLQRKVLASDIDAGAVAVAQQNAARNGVAKFVRVRRAAGYRDRAIRKSHYDLILSNILARPLAVLAADLGRNLEHGGRAVLSGLLRRQEPIVLAPHRGCGIVLDYRVVIDGWSTLVMRRGPKADVITRADAPVCECDLREGPVKPSCAVRIFPGSGDASAAGADRVFAYRRLGRRSGNGEARYRQASDHRVPSAPNKRVPGAATRKRPFRPKRGNLLQT
jgi:ribosomal protein L11 methyltransferase